MENTRGEEQLHAYLDRVDEKAQQIKQLAENILEYSLAAQNRPVELQEPLPAQEVLGEAFTRPSPNLSQCGYTYELALDFGEAQIAVHIPYIRRLVDNISSNILKYADRRFPGSGPSGDGGPWFFLRFPEPERRRGACQAGHRCGAFQPPFHDGADGRLHPGGADGHGLSNHLGIPPVPGEKGECIDTPKDR